VVRDAVNHVLDGESSFENLEGCEKATFGIRFEKRFIKAMNLPRKVSKRNNPHNLLLDTRVAGFHLDIKTTLGGKNWMIPQECIGHWCLLVKVDWRQERFSIGLVRADRHTLTNGTNQDKKHSFSAFGQGFIYWIGEGISYT
jgi:hypothetical protein